MGEIKDGKEETKDWAGALEDYHLKDQNGMTELIVEMDMNEEFHDYFNKTFPKALLAVKQMAEGNSI